MRSGTPRREIVHGRGCTPMKRDIYLYRPPRVAGYIMLQFTKKDWQRQGGDSWLDTGQLAAVSQLVDLSQLVRPSQLARSEPVGLIKIRPVGSKVASWLLNWRTTQMAPQMRSVDSWLHTRFWCIQSFLQIPHTKNPRFGPKFGTQHILAKFDPKHTRWICKKGATVDPPVGMQF